MEAPADEQVHWLATAATARVANYYGTAITQSGHSEAQYDTANVQNVGYTYNDGGLHPMWAAGLDVRATSLPHGTLVLALTALRLCALDDATAVIGICGDERRTDGFTDAAAWPCANFPTANRKTRLGCVWLTGSLFRHHSAGDWPDRGHRRHGPGPAELLLRGLDSAGRPRWHRKRLGH